MTTNPTDRPARRDQPDRPDLPGAPLMLRTPHDVLAAVPVVLGFEPQESMVMMTFGGREAFHARVDLPRSGDREALRVVVDQLLVPAAAHGVRGVVVIVYTADRAWGEVAESSATTAFDDAGLTVHASLRSDGSRWWAPGWPGPQWLRTGDPGTPYDSSSHPFRASSVLRGQVVHRSRQELAALLAPVPTAVAAVRAVRSRGRTVGADGVRALVAQGVTDGPLDDPDLVALLLGLRRTGGRDAAWSGLTRPDAEEHVRFWVDVVQRAPADLVATPAAVLGLAAWVAGHGALAWCAVDRCRALAPRHSLAGLVADLLSDAVSPSSWSAHNGEDETR